MLFEQNFQKKTGSRKAPVFLDPSSIGEMTARVADGSWVTQTCLPTPA